MSARILPFVPRVSSAPAPAGPTAAPTCPDCGGSTTTDRTAHVETSYLPIRAIRGVDVPIVRLAPVVVEHCTRCEWTRVVDRLDAIARGRAR